MNQTIEVVDVGQLAAPSSPEREAMDAALGRAAERLGFLVIAGGPVAAVMAEGRIERLLNVFTLPSAEKRRLMTRRHEPTNPNSYHGFYIIERSDAGLITEGFDMGADRAAPSDDPIEAYLLEPNVWPDETLLPGWRLGALGYYTAMEEIGRLVMSAMARYLGLAEDRFERDFTTGVSTLRLVHMIDRIQEDPADTQGRYRAVIDGKIRRLSRASHTDSGVLTLLWQPGDLQAQAPDGSWLDVPVVPGSLTVNFGDCMALWTSGRIQAAHHRVLARPGERWSVPFFYEPDASTEIMPLFESAHSAHPVRYGEHVLARIRASDIATADHVAA